MEVLIPLSFHAWPQFLRRYGPNLSIQLGQAFIGHLEQCFVADIVLQVVLFLQLLAGQWGLWVCFQLDVLDLVVRNHLLDLCRPSEALRHCPFVVFGSVFENWWDLRDGLGRRDTLEEELGLNHLADRFILCNLCGRNVLRFRKLVNVRVVGQLGKIDQLQGCGLETVAADVAENGQGRVAGRVVRRTHLGFSPFFLRVRLDDILSRAVEVSFLLGCRVPALGLDRG